MGFNSFLILILSFACHAQEPGHFDIETQPPPPAASPPPSDNFLKNNHRAILREQFNRAKGLSDSDARNLGIQRISCDRRVYSPTGWSLEGNADVKAVAVTADLYEMEFPSSLYMRDLNPYQNHVMEIEAVASRQLVDLGHWQDGQSLKIFKTVSVSNVDDDAPAKAVFASDEIKVIEESFPPMYIVKEIVLTEKPFSYYFLCH